MRALRGLLAAAGVAFTLPGLASAQTPPYPPAGYAPLLFDSADTKYVFRLNGTPWICRGDTFCKPIKIEGVADKDLAQAAIESLGFAGPRYFLSYRQANFEKGKEVALSCTEERCSKLDSIAGDTSPLGTYQVKQGDRMVTRTALLRQVEAKNGRAQLLWCTETDCSELPLTRDAELYLASMGSSRNDGRAVAWLRDKSGAVLSCSQPEEGVSDQLACEKTKIVLGDFPATVAAPAPAPTPPPAPAPTTSDADRNALSAAIDRAITTGDFANADRLLADAARRYAGNAAWPPLQQKLAKARADRDAQLHQAEARRLIAEARRFAQAGDFSHAEEMLRDADKQVPGFAETVQARAEIASLRTARGQRYRERSQYTAAIDQALASAAARGSRAAACRIRPTLQPGRRIPHEGQPPGADARGRTVSGADSTRRAPTSPRRGRPWTITTSPRPTGSWRSPIGPPRAFPRSGRRGPTSAVAAVAPCSSRTIFA